MTRPLTYIDRYFGQQIGHRGYNPNQPRDPVGTSTGGQWASIFGNREPDPQKPGNFRTEGATVRFRLGGDSDTFEIRGMGMARVHGYWRNADFPGEYGNPTRGEIYYVDAGISKGQGVGTNLMLDAINLMKVNGAKTFNLSPTNPAAKKLNEKLAGMGVIKFLRSSGNKEEYEIL